MKKILFKLSTLILLLCMAFCFTGCSIIKEVENLSPYEKLINYLKEETYDVGEACGDVKTYGDYQVMIDYKYETKDLSFTMTSASNSMIVLEKIKESNMEVGLMGRCRLNSKDYIGTGYINKKTFHTGRYIFNFVTDAPYSLESDVEKYLGASAYVMLMYINKMIESYDIGVTLNDLGFEGYYP